MPPPGELCLSRVYDDQPDDPSYRVLVDRLWPRGVTTADAGLDEWLKDVAPSAELRRWYDHDVDKFIEFARRYRAELRRPPASAPTRARPLTARQAPHGDPRCRALRCKGPS
jgi:uncharacterized protein YeaO (DUF488 family)